MIGDLTIRTGLPEIARDRYTAQLEGAERYAAVLDLSYFDTSVSRLPPGSELLFDATIDHVGAMRFDVSGTKERRISLGSQGWAVLTGPYTAGGQVWDIQLSPDVPLDLEVNMGSGDLAMDLVGFALSRLRVDGGSGDAEMALPRGTYEIDVDGGSGEQSLTISDGSNVDIDMDCGSGNVQVIVGSASNIDLLLSDGGSGDLSLSVPRTTGLAVEVQDAGSGSLLLAPEPEQEYGDAKEGLWKSPGYGSAQYQVLLRAVDLGSGDLIVSYR